jgi:hypothetical protein
MWECELRKESCRYMRRKAMYGQNSVVSIASRVHAADYRQVRLSKSTTDIITDQRLPSNHTASHRYHRRILHSHHKQAHSSLLLALCDHCKAKDSSL